MKHTVLCWAHPSVKLCVKVVVEQWDDRAVDVKYSAVQSTEVGIEKWDDRAVDFNV